VIIERAVCVVMSWHPIILIEYSRQANTMFTSLLAPSLCPLKRSLRQDLVIVIKPCPSRPQCFRCVVSRTSCPESTILLVGSIPHYFCFLGLGLSTASRPSHGLCFLVHDETSSPSFLSISPLFGPPAQNCGRGPGHSHTIMVPYLSTGAAGSRAQMPWMPCRRILCLLWYCGTVGRIGSVP
jgi:hypothetical protein